MKQSNPEDIFESAAKDAFAFLKDEWDFTGPHIRKENVALAHTYVRDGIIVKVTRETFCGVGITAEVTFVDSLTADSKIRADVMLLAQAIGHSVRSPQYDALIDRKLDPITGAVRFYALVVKNVLPAVMADPATVGQAARQRIEQNRIESRDSWRPTP